MPSWTPQWLWQQQVAVVQRIFMWITTGLYDEPIREMMGLSWSDADQRRFERFGKTVNTVMRLVPRRYRRHPRARDADDRLTGRVPADAPLLETPRRNLPSEAERDNPIHYCPVHAKRRANLPWQSDEVDD